ncbi:MAG: HAMP domain-containing histidine kinase [Magnetococcales bacterium]|nr:HAMP domain-containing histidine kinase [Magnetococcales bacterium]MBF0149445.1 HAMP domain-containing histidine kinase [Magnetococcales bacterium]
MSSRLDSPRQLWERIWRRTTLTVKALFVSVTMGWAFWLLTDLWQSSQIHAIFRQEQLDKLEIQALHDRLLFDEYIRKQEQSVRLISFLTPLIHWIEANIQNELPTLRQWNAENRPPWLPPPSIMRNLVAASHILLLDENRKLRESYAQEDASHQLSSSLTNQVLPHLLASDEYSHIASDAQGTIYLINVSGIMGKKSSEQPKAFLVLVVALNADFLSLFHTRSNSDGIVVLFNGDTNLVIASNQPDKIKEGTSLDELNNRYDIIGKRFLDYNFSIDIPIHFASLVSKDETFRIISSIQHEERRHRAIGYTALAAIFFALVFFLTRKLKIFTEGMIGTAIHQLGLKKQNVASGDQLLIMGEQFQWMIDEILRSRRREQARQEELEQTNQALQQSLVVVKRTQAQLVEAEKMASLGNLVAGVAHEINTPVGSSVTAASFLKQESQKCAAHFADGTLRKSELESYFQDVTESTQMILQNLHRAADLVRSFKQVAVDRTSETRRNFRLHECIQHTLLSLRPHLKQTRHKVTVHCPESLEINSYPGVFSQIISNFVINSLIHGFHEINDGEINFDVSHRDDRLVFRYSDNGHGMPEEVRKRIYEPFFTTARNRGGSGLGMHIVFNLVTQTLKGTLQCVSSPGQGTLYELCIPMEPGTTGE